MTGKLIGGALGFMAGGVIGGLLGLIFGHWFDQALGVLRPNVMVQRQLVELCFALMGRVCKADGVVSQEEVDAAEQVMARLGIQGEARQLAIKAFNRGKSDGFDVEHTVLELRRLCQGRQMWLRMALEILLAGAIADGRIDDAESQLLAQIASGLGFSPTELQHLLSLLGAHPETAGRAEDRLAEAYKVLDVAPNADDSSVKKAYRRLMSQHHPDKLAARGLPEAMRRQAEEQTRKIRTAWETIKTARGL